MEQLRKRNVEPATVAGFADEWTRFDQAALSPVERQALFDQYFHIFPWAALPERAEGFDLGCGSGRWATCVAPRVGRLHCIDASAEVLSVAKRNLADQGNCEFHVASVDEMPFPDGSMDFGYSIGVLHHVPDAQAGVDACVAKLKPGAPLLLYLYYAFDNRPAWFRALWKTSDLLRRLVSRLPPRAQLAFSTVVATTVYYPLARFALALEKLGARVESWPLAYYRARSFYTMRTDARDRFGTRLEQRFTARQVRHMMDAAGLERIEFSSSMPCWCAVGFRRR